MKTKEFNPELEILKGLEKQQNKIAEAKRLKLEAEINQKPVKEIVFTIEWKHSAMWGNNPNLECAVRFQDGSFERSETFKASGCGYDKESTVVAAACNKYLKYTLHSITPKKALKAPYGIYLKGRLQYDPDHVSFNSGVGMSCYYNIAEFIGGKLEHISSGKTFDVYKLTL